MAKKKEEFDASRSIFDDKKHFDDQPGCQADKDFPTAVEDALNKAAYGPGKWEDYYLKRDFAPTSYVAASCQNARTESTSTPGISYSESDPGGQTHTRWYYGFRIARALIISGTIIYTIHRGLFEFLAWVFAKR